MLWPDDDIANEFYDEVILGVEMPSIGIKYYIFGHLYYGLIINPSSS